jgi:hypothetical protein
LVLTEPEKVAIDAPFERVIETLMVDGVSRSAACRMLMARLAVEHEVADTDAVPHTIRGEDQRYG